MYHNVLVPLDGSPLAECVLPHVETVAKGYGVKNVTFIRVVPLADLSTIGGAYVFSDEERKRMEAANEFAAEEYLKQLTSRVKYGGVTVKSEVIIATRAADIPDIIVEYAAKKKVDLIIIATHGRSGISRAIWGRVAGQILRTSHLPVLMVRPEVCS